jgi:hypothetical protein
VPDTEVRAIMESRPFDQPETDEEREARATATEQEQHARTAGEQDHSDPDVYRDEDGGELAPPEDTGRPVDPAEHEPYNPDVNGEVDQADVDTDGAGDERPNPFS